MAQKQTQQEQGQGQGQKQEQQHWLDKYANNAHTWQPSTDPTTGITSFERPLGLVESAFDIDGTHYGGRADMTGILTLHIAHSLSPQALRHRIALAWTNLTLHHVLLRSRMKPSSTTGALSPRKFVVDVPASPSEAVTRTSAQIVWLSDFYPVVDEQDLHHHALNVTRIIDPATCLAKLLVLPLVRLPDGTHSLRLLTVFAHQISDGLSAYTWFSDLLRILNTPARGIEEDIAACVRPERVYASLPPAQEDLYPKISGSRARQRWFWALVRVLRHVHKPLPPTFANPLFRATRLDAPPQLPQTYSKVFDYSAATRPPMAAAHITAALSPAASARLMALCRGARVSVGAGCFALAGLSMMSFQSPPPDAPPPSFAASFPLNPRAFFANPPAPNSCMLAFSDGILMPHLPASLPLETRFRIVARRANKELRVFQKRRNADDNAERGALHIHSPTRLLATGYVAQIERVAAKLSPAEQALRMPNPNPQGALPAATGAYGATCGVSSVGSTAGFFAAGAYELLDLGERDFAADYRGLKMGVRAREREFLVGSSTDADGIVGFGVSYDACAISRETAEEWAGRIGGLLEGRGGVKL
ncbi:hypothetical protein P153DRAFT_393823 [Dothidotthia symphoricarpi CBS 119687]|uniref:CoA-dependent acyltransferase n=1 Tax=Dothidotthia symphoricarpi CBS 119687 TaxID=1392245 RepID=A0A6A6ALR4_9PLEO|nr:uncharacterized protein P153DRAFT_393823 [Dothidotthia symphoricarpi CBS 119687]KAF2132879.1 hypothetical protein P153DRAFT_393823 [Dothidotthia symphoricarpi CBS 119687]